MNGCGVVVGLRASLDRRVRVSKEGLENEFEPGPFDCSGKNRPSASFQGLS